MLRLRFASGLTLGLALGVPSGALMALLIVPPRTSSQNGATSLQVDLLTRKLEVANEDRQRMERQLEQFQKLAEQMTASFNNLELRFKALEEEQRVREPVRVNPPPAPPPPPAPAPAAAAPAADGPPRVVPDHPSPPNIAPPDAVTDSPPAA